MTPYYRPIARPIGGPAVRPIGGPSARPIPTYPSFTGLSSFELTSAELWYLLLAAGSGMAIAHVAGKNMLVGAGIGALGLIALAQVRALSS